MKQTFFPAAILAAFAFIALNIHLTKKERKAARCGKGIPDNYRWWITALALHAHFTQSHQ